MLKFFKSLERLTTAPLAILSALIVLLVGFADYLTGDEIDLSIFYFLPIFVVSWLGRPKLAYFFASMSAVERVVADTLAGHIYAHPSIPLWNSLAHFLIFFAVAYMVGRLRQQFDTETKLSRTDTLTGSANTRHLHDYANTTIERQKRHHADTSLVYLDLDNFKWVNDNLGHQIGDQVLITTANVIRKNIRSIDLLARIGGDEFVIFLPDANHEQAVDAMERLNPKLLKAIDKNQWPVTISMGIASFTNPVATLEEMIKHADELMYEAKKAGKNKMVARIVN